MLIVCMCAGIENGTSSMGDTSSDLEPTSPERMQVLLSQQLSITDFCTALIHSSSSLVMGAMDRGLPWLLSVAEESSCSSPLYAMLLYIACALELVNATVDLQVKYFHSQFCIDEEDSIGGIMKVSFVLHKKNHCIQ